MKAALQDQQHHPDENDPQERLERIGVLPDKISPLATADRDFDLFHMRSAQAAVVVHSTPTAIH